MAGCGARPLWAMDSQGCWLLAFRKLGWKDAHSALCVMGMGRKGGRARTPADVSPEGASLGAEARGF